MVVTTPHTAEADMDFQGKHAGEKFQFYFHQHWILLLWPFVKFIVKLSLLFGMGYVTLFAIGIEEAISRRLVMEFFSGLFLLISFEPLVRLYRFLLRVTVVTDRKVHRICKSLLIIDDHQSMDLWMLQDADRWQHSICENILGYGTITLEVQDTVLNLHYVPRVKRCYERIMHLREIARDQISPYSSLKRMVNSERIKV